MGNREARHFPGLHFRGQACALASVYQVARIDPHRSAPRGILSAPQPSGPGPDGPGARPVGHGCPGRREDIPIGLVACRILSGRQEPDALAGYVQPVLQERIISQPPGMSTRVAQEKNRGAHSRLAGPTTIRALAQTSNSCAGSSLASSAASLLNQAAQVPDLQGRTHRWAPARGHLGQSHPKSVIQMTRPEAATAHPAATYCPERSNSMVRSEIVQSGASPAGMAVGNLTCACSRRARQHSGSA